MYSRVLSQQRVENIKKVKVASEADQENFAFLATKYEKQQHQNTWSVQKWGGGWLKTPSPTPLKL